MITSARPVRLRGHAGARLIAPLALAFVMAAAACGAASASGHRVDRAAARTSAHHALTLNSLPSQVRQYYKGFQYFSKLLPDAYASWKPPKPPWKFCYNESYLGNTWRQSSLAEYQKLVQQYEHAGLAKGGLTVTNSDNNVDLQLSQLNTLINEGCNVLISIPGSPTALCSGVAHAFAHHVLFISDESPTYCKDAINVTFNDYWDANIGAKAVLKSIGYKGNVLIELGIPGLSDTVAETKGIMDAIHGHPGIHVLGEVNGQWTPSIAKTATLEFLSTHPQKVDAIIDEGQEDVTPEQALQQSGRPLAKENSFSGECSFMAFWKQHPDIAAVAVNQGGAPAMYESFEVAARMLAGQKPVVNTLIYPVPEITRATFARWYKPSMTLQSTCYPNPPGGRAVPDSYFDVLFRGGHAPKVAPKP
jgi:ribose transport system substrate-binding protein